MYSTVTVRIGISWCGQYCVIKDRNLLFHCPVSGAFVLFLMLFYYFIMQKLVAPQSLSQVHTLAFRRYIYDHQVEEAESPLCGANDQCASPKYYYIVAGHEADRHEADRHKADRHETDRHKAYRHEADRTPSRQDTRTTIKEPYRMCAISMAGTKIYVATHLLSDPSTDLDLPEMVKRNIIGYT